jgi:hypothetical protein
MAPAELLRLVRARPFVPFRLIMREGSLHEVHRPDLVLVALHLAAVGYPDPEREGLATRIDVIALRHVVHIEFFSEPAPSPLCRA